VHGCAALGVTAWLSIPSSEMPSQQDCIPSSVPKALARNEAHHSTREKKAGHEYGKQKPLSECFWHNILAKIVVRGLSSLAIGLYALPPEWDETPDPFWDGRHHWLNVIVRL
jgi:hypothetical protein